MSKTLFWFQAGGCGGDSMAFLSNKWPNISEFIRLNHIELLWHPSFSDGSPAQYIELIDALLSGEQPLDILCVEGFVVRGPGGTGMYDTLEGKPKKDLIAGMAKRAEVVVAVGTCAAFGGVGTVGEVEAVGLQFHRETMGGFLGKDYRSRSGRPVINLPGCPCHMGVTTGALSMIASGSPLPLNEHNAPLDWYGLLVHQGCIRNEYHEYRVEENDFGQRGCLFFHMGCRGPLTRGPCNKLQWNGQRSKTSVGVPCSGCTRPDFPQSNPFFRTRNIAGVPIDLPEGVDRAHYLAYKGMAAAAAPERLKSRKTRV
ncbi:MAG: NADH:ubiquinone oxidoreductase [Deltaproteobacteria bacterium]|nr:NADH:ubiquinone oxidoreductase [Deltaproteobacteria bacterium]